jgi:hypothetical protein
VDAIRSFLTKYSAAPADDGGPAWSECPDDVLLDWHRAYRRIVVLGAVAEIGGHRPATAAEQQAAGPFYREVVAEIVTRAKRENASPAVLATYLVTIRRDHPRA